MAIHTRRKEGPYSKGLPGGYHRGSRQPKKKRLGAPPTLPYPIWPWKQSCLFIWKSFWCQKNTRHHKIASDGKIQMNIFLECCWGEEPFLISFTISVIDHYASWAILQMSKEEQFLWDGFTQPDKGLCRSWARKHGRVSHYSPKRIREENPIHQHVRSGFGWLLYTLTPITEIPCCKLSRAVETS